MKHLTVLLAFALVAWCQAPKPGLIVGGSGGGGGGGTITGCGFGQTLNGTVCDTNTAVIPSNVTLQSGAPLYCAGSASTTATCSLNPVLTAYTNGMVVNFKAGATNTTTYTLNIDELGAKSILTAEGDALIAGNITSGRYYALTYDGTQFRLPPSGAGGLSTDGIIDLPIGGANLSGSGQFSGYIVSGGLTNAVGATWSLMEFTYDAATARTAIWKFRFPRRWVPGSVTLNLMGYAGVANQSFQMDVAIVCDVAGTGTTPTFPADTSTGLITPFTVLNQKFQISLASIPTTGCAAGDLGQLRLQRRPGVGTMTGAAVVISAAAINITEQ